MTPNEVEVMARELIAQHLPEDSGWTFRLDRSKTRFGQSRVKLPRSKNPQKSISISGPLSAVNSEGMVRNTILHEIAHALDYEKNGRFTGHGPIWKALATEVGANPETCILQKTINLPTKGASVGTCPNGHTMLRYRIPKALMSCGECFPTYNPDFRFTWTRDSAIVAIAAAQKVKK